MFENELFLKVFFSYSTVILFTQTSTIHLIPIRSKTSNESRAIRFIPVINEATCTAGTQFNMLIIFKPFHKKYKVTL